MIKSLMVILASCLYAEVIFAQTSPLPLEWQKTIGGSESDELIDMIQTKDGGYIAVGFSYSFISGDKTADALGYDQVDAWVVKLNNLGKIEWQKTLGSTNNDIPANIIQLSDGGFLLGISASSNAYSGGISGTRTVAAKGSADYWIVKLDASGNNVWQKAYGGSVNSFSNLISVIPSDDGGFLMSGTAGGPKGGDRTGAPQGNSDYWVVKADASGNILWDRNLGSNEDDAMNYGGNPTCVQTSDKGYLIGGYSSGGIFGDKTVDSRGEYDYWIIKLNNAGVPQWQKRYGGTGNDIFTTLVATRDGGYLLGGFSNSEISGDKKEMVIGSDDYGYQNDFWVLKVDAAGTIEWERTLGGDKEDRLSTAIQTPDGGFLLGGRSNSGISGIKTEASVGDRGEDDFWLVRLNAAGEFLWDKTIGGDDKEYLKIIRPTADGGFVLGGISMSGISGNKTDNYVGPYSNNDYWIVKVGKCTGANPVIKANGANLSSVSQFPSYQWLFNGVALANADKPVYQADKTGLYALVIVDNKGCIDTSAAKQIVMETNLYIPNVFSPNGDSKNDLFKVYGNLVAAVRMQIFNQWGQMIFETSDGLKGWDGRSNGNVQPAGTYAYIVEVTLPDGSVVKRKGSINLVK